MRRTLLYLSFVAVIASCSDRSRQPEQNMSDTSKTSSPPSVQVPSGTIDTVPVPTGSAFERAVYDDYARLGVTLPRRVTDSIMKLNDPQKIQPAMERLTKRQDSIARQTIVDRYHISIDSLEKILKKGKQERAAER